MCWEDVVGVLVLTRHEISLMGFTEDGWNGELVPSLSHVPRMY